MAGGSSRGLGAPSPRSRGPRRGRQRGRPQDRCGLLRASRRPRRRDAPDRAPGWIEAAGGAPGARDRSVADGGRAPGVRGAGVSPRRCSIGHRSSRSSGPVTVDRRASRRCSTSGAPSTAGSTRSSTGGLRTALERHGDGVPREVRTAIEGAIDEAMLVAAGELDRRSRAELDREARFRERFLAILGHDLRQP